MITLRDEKFFKQVVKVYKQASIPSEYNTNERGFNYWLKENYNCRRSNKGMRLVFKNNYDATMFLIKYSALDCISNTAN
jgi:hypothetical protein